MAPLIGSAEGVIRYRPRSAFREPLEHQRRLDPHDRGGGDERHGRSGADYRHQPAARGCHASDPAGVGVGLLGTRWIGDRVPVQRVSALATRGPALTMGVLALATVVAWGLILGPLQNLGIGGMQAATMRVEVPLFMITWVVMLAAMMLPAVTPMVVTYQRITAARGKGSVMLVAFVFGYLIVWSASGIVPLVFNLVLPQVQMSIGTDGWARLFAFPLLTVGVFQLSPWKAACLKACRSPLGFFMAHDFGAGPTGAVRLGGLHGLICVGCCWALMALMVVAGGMSTAWMAVLALVFITEKVWRHGLALSRVVGAGALAAAVLVLVTGWAL